MTDNAWSIYTLDKLTQGIEGSEPRFVEFLRTSTLSCAIYHLPAGAQDMQAPHLEDELYFVVSGRAKLRIAGQEREVSAGNILYVRATAKHSFFDIDQGLTLVAVFGSAKAARLLRKG